MISIVLQYSTVDLRFLKANLTQVSKFSSEIIIPICTHLFNGQLEDEEKLKESYQIIEAFPNAKVISFKWNNVGKPSRYYHNLSRKVGTDNATNEWVLFIDADEFLSEEFIPWFKSVKDTDSSYWFTCYWYFREATNQATQLEGAGLLTKRQYCTWDLDSEQERQQLFNKLPNFTNGDHSRVLSNTGVPLMHHYSWVRSKEEMLNKVRNWGHTSDKDWVALVEEEFNKSFNGTDFVHGYSYNIVENKFNL